MTNPGFWTDVILLSDGGFLQVTTDGPLVRGFVRGVEMWRIDAPEPLLFCRASLWQGQPISIHQGNQSGLAWLVTPSFVRSLGVTFGVQPVAIDSTYAYIVRSSTVYERIRLDDFSAEQFPNTECPGSSQGWSDLRDGVLYWADLHRSVVCGGLTLTYPNTRGAVTVGQADPAQIAGWNSAALFTAFSGDGFEPHLAFNGSAYAIVARTPAGAAYLEVPPYPPFVGAEVPPEPPEPTPEPPEPEPGPEPPEPTPVPPQPIPAPFRRHLKGTPVDTIDGKIVLLRGPAGLLACPDAPNTGTWGSLNQGWRGFRWLDAHSPDATAQHRCTKVGDRYTFTNLVMNGLAGADATKHSGSIPQQFYYKPDGNTDAGGYELWQVYDGNANGALEAQIEYTNDEGRYFACPLAVEVVG